MSGRGPRRRRDASPDRPPPDDDAAMEVAARFLAARPRTRWELERRLRRAGASDSVIEGTIERLASLGYVDDAAFVRWWAEQRDRHSPRGRRLVEVELRQRGVSRELLGELRDEELSEPALDHERLPGTEEERALAALERHLRGRPLPTEAKALQRIGMYLVRRGFDPAAARSAIRTLAEQVPDALEEEEP